MSDQTGYYCVIQYCPDRGRDEAANVGVLLYVPASRTVRAKVGPLSRRAMRFFGLNADGAVRPNAAVRSMAYLINSGKAAIDSVDSLRTFVATRANDVRLTVPRLVVVSDFARDLDGLYAELVEPEQVTVPAGRPSQVPPVPQRLYDVFTRLSLQGKVTTPGKIPVPLMGRELDVPYAYQNGVLNLVKPEVFAKEKSSVNRAVTLAAEGQLLEKHPAGRDRRLIVVAGPGSVAAAETQAARLLGELGVKFVPQSAADAFADEVERGAH